MTRIAAALAVVGALLLTIGGALGYLMHGARIEPGRLTGEPVLDNLIS